MRRSIVCGIKLQVKLVDQVTLDFFFNKLNLLCHLEICHRFYFMKCGDLMNKFCFDLYKQIVDFNCWHHEKHVKNFNHLLFDDATPEKLMVNNNNNNKNKNNTINNTGNESNSNGSSLIPDSFCFDSPNKSSDNNSRRKYLFGDGSRRNESGISVINPNVIKLNPSSLNEIFECAIKDMNYDNPKHKDYNQCLNFHFEKLPKNDVLGNINSSNRKCLREMIGAKISNSSNDVTHINDNKMHNFSKNVGSSAFLIDLFLNYSCCRSFLIGNNNSNNYDASSSEIISKYGPLESLFFNKKNIDCYNCIFIFFMYLKRVESQLLQLWTELKNKHFINDNNNNNSNRASNSRLRLLNKKMCKKYNLNWNKIHLFRRECSHLIENLLSFFSNQVLNVSWIVFMKKLLNKDICFNILKIEYFHSEYLNTILEMCFLKDNDAQRQIRTRLHKMFELMIQFKHKTCQLIDIANNYYYLGNNNIGLYYYNSVNGDGNNDESEKKNNDMRYQEDRTLSELSHCMESVDRISKSMLRIIYQLNKKRVNQIIDSLSMQLDFNYFYQNINSKPAKSSQFHKDEITAFQIV